MFLGKLYSKCVDTVSGLGGFGTGITSTASSGISLGSSTGFALSAPKTTASTGLSLGGFGTTATSASTGLTVGAAKPTGLTLGKLQNNSDVKSHEINCLVCVITNITFEFARIIYPNLAFRCTCHNDRDSKF